MRLILKLLIILWLTLISVTQWEQQKAIEIHNEVIKSLVYGAAVQEF